MAVTSCSVVPRRSRKERSGTNGGLYHDKLRTPLSIAFAFVATHNHFVLDRGGKVFNRSAPIIKLPAERHRGRPSRPARPAQQLHGLLLDEAGVPQQGQHGRPKGARQRTADDSRLLRVHWHTDCSSFPIPHRRPLSLARLLDRLGQECNASLPDASCGRPLRPKLAWRRPEPRRHASGAA